eukprot:CAMPEP_0204310018 /NCGR_PEP_ID=MMETSP0469-20131031/1455_1 /ASSEMBLY_ACC=CAM_ASM_000384 /TAXON_ID=2969 /ORGANISM="Oxyrrhis marina" /LENGTH=352 /DNA_ID=CAMNT_0051289723 /DNA_START=10 /DNA_END=1065 /DNA_ORIENTATION=-
MSLFHRLALDAGCKPLKLEKLHRPIAKTCGSIQKALYGASLAGVPVTTRPVAGFPWPKPGVGAAFVDIFGEETVDGSHVWNVTEVEEIFHIVVDLICSSSLADGVKASDIAVISPYASQVRRIQQRIHADLLSTLQGRGKAHVGVTPDMVTVRSVEDFVGREKPVVIVSCVRSNAFGDVGWCGDWRRMNVALSRATRGLIVCGNSRTVKLDAMLSAWLDWAQEEQICIRAGPEPPPEPVPQPSASAIPLGMPPAASPLHGQSAPAMHAWGAHTQPVVQGWAQQPQQQGWAPQPQNWAQPPQQPWPQQQQQGWAQPQQGWGQQPQQQGWAQPQSWPQPVGPGTSAWVVQPTPD